jgi:hypothetical protein
MLYKEGITGKRLAMLKEIAPYLKRAAVMPTPSRRGPSGSESS